LDNYRDEHNMPEWLVKSDNYIPQTDKDTFVNKSILSVLKIISEIKTQGVVYTAKYSVNVPLRVIFTFILLLMLSLSRSFIYVIIINVYLLLFLSLMDADRIINILRLSLGMTFFTFAVMLPAVLWGNSYSCIMITSKVFATITVMGMLSRSTRWSAITAALKSFYVPDIFILVLDITIKYIFLLGDFTLNMLYALRLRSVGKNQSKFMSLAGIAGTMFLESRELAEDMYQAMECRGFTGEYHIHGKSGLTVIDYLYIVMNIGLILLFLYFGRILND
jgi:cobalt/nickel transport system permease protein